MGGNFDGGEWLGGMGVRGRRGGAKGEGSKGVDTNCERMIIDLLIVAGVPTW
jgi:hypothetical protein